MVNNDVLLGRKQHAITAVILKTTEFLVLLLLNNNNNNDRLTAFDPGQPG